MPPYEPRSMETDVKSSKYFDRDQNFADLVNRIDPKDREDWDFYGHLKVEPCFQDRVFVLYRATGRDRFDVQRPPEIVTTFRVLSFTANDISGCTVRILDQTTNKDLEFSHVPVKLFGYPIFVCVPASFTVRWDLHQLGTKLIRSLLYIILVKARNKAEFFSKGNFYLETPNKMRELYPHLDLNLEL